LRGAAGLQWQRFLRKNGLDSMPMQLGEVISRIATFLGPVITTARGNIAING
jgi:hypothetical protein